jgi:hypothetical protein
MWAGKSTLESYFFILHFFPRLFSTFPQTPAAHLLTLRVTPMCRGTPVKNRCSRELVKDNAFVTMGIH